MAVATRSELFEALGQDRYDDIVGSAETTELEFKSAPYLPWDDDRRLEFAKDVSAIANGGGGVLIFGFKTTPDTLNARDVVTEQTPVPTDKVDLNAYRQALAAWTYPPVTGVEMRWWGVVDGKGYLTLDVPATPDSQQPTLVTKATADGLKKAILVGHFVRSGDQVNRTTAPELHAAIRLGRFMGQLGLSSQGLSVAGPSGPTSEQREQRLTSDLSQGEFTGRPRYYLQAWPNANAEVVGILSRDYDSLRRRMPFPQELRQYGWGMRSGAQPTDIPNGGLRVVSSRLTLSLERTGLLSLIAAADSTYLAWADERRGRPNGLVGIAVVESTLEFMRFFKNEVMPRCQPPVAQWTVAGGMADLIEGPTATSLHDGPTSRFSLEWHTATASAFQFGPITFAADITAGHAAFRVLREVYAQFGMDEAEIPYVQDGEVSEAIIAAITS